LNRTFPEDAFFQEEGSGIRKLEEVLRALAVTYEDMGYCQGLNFVVGLLSLYLTPESTY
jgi:hypothetical protein